MEMKSQPREGPEGFWKGLETERCLLYSRTGQEANVYCFRVSQEEDLK